MKITRVLNSYMTPVFSEDISKDKTGVGQMTKQQIVDVRDQLSLMNNKKYFYLIGTPITYSPSPTFHNKVFSLLNLPYEYKKLDTEDVECAMYIIEKQETIG